MISCSFCSGDDYSTSQGTIYDYYTGKTYRFNARTNYGSGTSLSDMIQASEYISKQRAKQEEWKVKAVESFFEGLSGESKKRDEKEKLDRELENAELRLLKLKTAEVERREYELMQEEIILAKDITRLPVKECAIRYSQLNNNLQKYIRNILFSYEPEYYKKLTEELFVNEKYKEIENEAIRKDPNFPNVCYWAGKYMEQDESRVRDAEELIKSSLNAVNDPDKRQEFVDFIYRMAGLYHQTMNERANKIKSLKSQKVKKIKSKDYVIWMCNEIRKQYPEYENLTNKEITQKTVVINDNDFDLDLYNKWEKIGESIEVVYTKEELEIAKSCIEAIEKECNEFKKDYPQYKDWPNNKLYIYILNGEFKGIR